MCCDVSPKRMRQSLRCVLGLLQAMASRRKQATLNYLAVLRIRDCGLVSPAVQQRWPVGDGLKLQSLGAVCFFLC